MDINNTNQNILNNEEILIVSEFEQCCSELSGKDGDGRPLATISYQTYFLEEEEHSTAKELSYPLTTPWVQIWIDKLNPGFVGVDIAFRSFDDPELRLMWNRLNRHIRNMSKEPEKTWIFYIKILDNASLNPLSKEIKMMHIINPSIFFLTRETPTMLATNSESNYGLQGGNIIRMLVPEESVSIDISPNEDYDLDTIKAEVLRDAEESAYQNATYLEDDNYF